MLRNSFVKVGMQIGVYLLCRLRSLSAEGREEGEAGCHEHHHAGRHEGDCSEQAGLDRDLPMPSQPGMLLVLQHTTALCTLCTCLLVSSLLCSSPTPVSAIAMEFSENRRGPFHADPRRRQGSVQNQRNGKYLSRSRTMTFASFCNLLCPALLLCASTIPGPVTNLGLWP